MTGSIYDWQITADNNATADGDINWQEQQEAETVNNSARRMMGRTAEFLGDLAPKRTSTGTPNVYQVTTNSAPSTGSLPDGFMVSFIAHQTNTSAATLYVNSFGGVPLRGVAGTALNPGEIQLGTQVTASYRASSSEFICQGSGASVSAFLSAHNALDITARIIPVGMPMPWFTETVPAGWLELNGQAVSRTTYAQLFAVYGIKYGAGDASTTFNVPNMCGKFIRGWDHAAGVDPDAASRTDRGDGTTGDHVGTKQADAYKSHTHTASSPVTDPGHGHSFTYVAGSTTANTPALYLSGIQGTGIHTSNASPDYVVTASVVSNTTGITVTTTNASSGGNETRPININAMWICLALPAVAAGGLDTGAKGSFTLANGLNSNIAATGNNSNRITGPTGAFSVGGFTGGADGQPLRLYNTTSQAMTLVNEDTSSTAANRIKTLTGSNVTLRSGTSFASLEYDATDSRWIMVSSN